MNSEDSYFDKLNSVHNKLLELKDKERKACKIAFTLPPDIRVTAKTYFNLSSGAGGSDFSEFYLYPTDTNQPAEILLESQIAKRNENSLEILTDTDRNVKYTWGPRI